MSHMDADECLYHSEQHELMLYLFISLIKIITNNVLVSMGCRFVFYWTFLSVYFAIPTLTHKSYG